MLRPTNAIIKDNVGNIIHRGFVVTGEVAVDNGDGSYDVYIAGEAKAYPKIFTLARNPDLAVGDKVRILYKGGCKELPIILPPTTIVTPLIATIFRQYSGNNYLNYYSMDGVLLNAYSLGNVYYPDDGNGMTIDRNNNVYYIKSPNYLTKVNSSGEELLSVAISGYPEAIAIGTDGYIYTREQDGKLHKRDISTFASLGYVTVSSYCGLVLDSSGNAYVVNTSSNKIEKWSSAGAKTGEQSIVNENDSCLGITSNYIIRSTPWLYGYSYKMPLALGAQSEITMTNIDWQHGCSGNLNYMFFIGENYSDYNLYLEKYTEGNVLEWSICADNSSYSPDYGMVAAYPF